ncbi:hypothetical protein L6164_003534 [Bauhinia variegata]|uniref:Uncharacterized protein n=1 Tax=Bauhinia variegata TaxID=167791 RepID=A0ACB9Q109_BAUVA|nr:hypothetical protein L6164_003534 [Bauhinia variegata]
MAMALAASFLVVLLAASTVYGVDHTVGGSAGWSLAAGDYANWASGQTITVGDNLVFNYDSSHGVDVVSEDDYNSCSSSKPINSFQGGSTKIPLTSSGKMYFICPSVGHCSGGMKLAVTVAAASNTPSGTPSTTPATSSPPSSSGTPATTTNNTTSPPHNGAVSGFGGITYLMGSLFTSAIAFAFIG